MKTTAILLLLSALMAILVLNWPRLKPAVFETVAATNSPEYMRILKPGETHAEAAQEANETYTILTRHITNPTPEQIATAQKYVDKTKNNADFWRKALDEVDEEEKIALAVENQDARDKLLFAAKEHRRMLVEHLIGLRADIEEKDRVFMHARGFDDATINDLQATTKVPWEP